MKKYLTLISLAVAAIAVGCTEGDKFDPDKEVLLMTGTANSALQTMVVEGPGAEYAVSVSATGKVKMDTKVVIRIDESALAEYNAAHGTSYQAVPSSAVTLSKSTLMIREGKASSEVATVTVTNDSFFENGVLYAIPVKIVEVIGDLDVLESSRVAIIKIARVIIFKSFNIGNTDMSSNYIFPEEQRIPLNNYTYEIKFRTPNLLTSTGDNPTRLCQFTQADETKSMLLRFNEATNDASEAKRTCRRLQVINPNDATLISNTKFDDNKWYMLTLTFDGSNVRFYVNGELDAFSAAKPVDFKFGRFEMGMSWGRSYRSSQKFIGDISEMRVWSRALSATEIKNGLCGVPSQSEGLEGYWKFDEGEGHIFHDSTGNGRDMDWSKTSRDNDDGKGMTPTPEAGAMADARWTVDPENNRCNS